MRKITSSVVLFCLVFLFFMTITGCNAVSLDFNAVNLDSNIASNHCVCKSKIYLDKYVLAENNKLVLVNDALSSGTNEITIDSLTSDGEYVYYLVSDIALTDDGADWDSRILRWDGTEMLDIARWDRPLSGSNNRSMKIHGDYIYFFRENDNGSNFVCRVQRDGGEVEALCENNTDITYTGIYFIDDSVYVQYNRNLYKTDLENLSPAVLSDDKMILSKVQRIFLQDGRFYYARYMDDSSTTNLYSMSPDGGDETLVLENIHELSVVFIDDMIYFSYNDPEEIGRVMVDGEEKIIYNQTHGSVYCYDIATGNITDVATDLDIVFSELFNINDSYILAEAYTNEQYVASASGYTTQYMLVPTDGSEAMILEMGT